MNRTKYIPSIIMLAADFIVCIATIYFRYSTKEILLIVLATSVIFLILGFFIKMFAEKYLVTDTMEEVLEEENREEEKTEDGAEQENQKTSDS